MHHLSCPAMPPPACRHVLAPQLASLMGVRWQDGAAGLTVVLKAEYAAERHELRPLVEGPCQCAERDDGVLRAACQCAERDDGVLGAACQYAERDDGVLRAACQCAERDNGVLGAACLCMRRTVCERMCRGGGIVALHPDVADRPGKEGGPWQEFVMAGGSHGTGRVSCDSRNGDDAADA
eukprot:354654-Chlamydomonas_euryale.AAC.8